MQKTKIEWVRNSDGGQGYVWNPIKGLCPVQCKLPDGKIYCYGRENYKRFKRDERIFLDLINEFGFFPPSKKRKGIFVCSTFELFHPITNTRLGYYDKKITWRDAIFHAIENTPQFRFYILTKFPQNIDRPMPNNVWLGVTVTKQKEMWKLGYIDKGITKFRFASLEPLLERITSDDFRLEISSLDWMIVGRLTQHGKKYDPKKEWIEHLKFQAGLYGIPLFLKDNLKNIWGEPLIQEFPDVK